MNIAAAVLPFQALFAMSESTQTEVLAYLGFPSSGRPVPDSDEPVRPATQVAIVQDEESPADLTVAMARRLIADPISPKSLAILRVIAESETPQFHLADAVAAAPETENYSDLKGAWSGLTRRTRKILGDGTADLIWWDKEAIYDGETYVDHVGRVSPLTHQSLRAVLKR